MKQLFFSVLTVGLAINLSAQSYKPAVKVNEGSKYQVLTSIKGNMTQEAMGQTMEIPMETNTNGTVFIKKISDKGYESGYIIDRMQLAVNMMGQEMNYDSDKKEDRDGQMGKDLNKLVGSETTFTVDAKGNIIKETIVKPKSLEDEADNSNMMTGMMGLNNLSGCPIFDLLSTTKDEIKVGDVLTDSISSDDKDGKSKTINIYTLKEIKDNMAIFSIDGKTNIEKKMEVQGMEMNMNSTAKNTGEMIIDIVTGLLSKKSVTIETTGNIDVQGMSIPISGKMTSTTTVSTK